MEAELIEKLSRINEFSDDLVNIITAITRDIHRPAWDIYTSKLAVILVNFTCQPKISYMRKSPSAAIAINNANKTLEDYCMDLILQLLLKLLKLKEDMVHKVTEFFLEVIEMNIHNVDTIILFYRVIFFSEKVVNYVLENNYLGIFIEQYEKIINHILKDFDNSERSVFINETLRSYFHGGSDFYTNLVKHIQTIGTPAQLELPNNIPNIPNLSHVNQEEDFDNRGTFFPPPANLEQGQNDGLPQGGTNNPNSEQSSFYLPTGNTTNHGSQSKSVKIPILNLPASFNDNVNTISRSTRRGDPYKSFSTNSNRLSNYGIGSNSIDFGAKDTTFQKNINENNMSILDNEHSYIYDDPLKVGVFHSAQDKMKFLANQLGEYCLTIDLGCLLAQKRKLQLDQVAHVAVFQDVDAIMDFKAEEKILREKFRKKKHKTLKKGKLANKGAGLGLGLNPEIKEVESSENSENESDNEPQGLREDKLASPHRSSLQRSMDKSDKKTDKHAARNKKKQELKLTWKSAHVMSNILLILLKEVDYEKLQQYGSLINMLYMALSTDISHRFRYKEKAKLALGLNYWHDTMDGEFSRHEELCEGIDNVERINRHFEKTLVEKHKARQVQMQQNYANAVANNANNSNHPLHQNSLPHVNASTFNGPQNLSHHPNVNNQASIVKSFTGNDSKKKAGLMGQKSLTFEMNTTNMKYFDSTVLHFSTTYDNENSSALTIPDESVDSIDELNSNQNLLNLDFILVPENVVYFKILDLFAIVSEKVHETLCLKYQNNYELEKPIEDPLSISLHFPNQSRLRPHSEKEKALETANVVNQHPGDSEFKVFIKGLHMDPAKDNNTKIIKKRANVFLHKYEKKLSWILNQVDMNNPFFYDMEIEQLGILESYLDVNTSKITTLEVIDNVFELLLLVKKQIIDLSVSFLTGSVTNTTTTRVVSPNLTAKAHRPGSMSRDLPTPSAPTSSTNIANNILRSVLRTNTSSRGMMNQELSPPKGSIDAGDNRGRSGMVFGSPFTNSFIYKQKELFLTYLGIISKLIVRAPKLDIYNLLNDVFITNDNWMELIKLFTISIFREIMVLCEKIGESNHIPIEKEQIHLFVNAKKILDYYTSVLVMCNTIIFKEKLNSSPSDPSKKKWKHVLKRILHSMMYLIKPQNGILAKYISFNTNINSLIINPRIQSLSNYNLVRINLFEAIYNFLRKIFSFPSRFSNFLNDEISTFYIRFSYINFVKLYSHSSNSELNEINRKIVEIGNRVKSKVGQENFNDNFDRIENEFRKNPKASNSELKTYQIHISKLYMKVLLAISKNRTEEIKHKFYQYRILEFFTREIDLEFDINQIRERFLRIRNEAKSKMLDKKESPIPPVQTLTSLNKRKSQNKLPEELEEESKERIDTYTSDVRVTNLSEADMPFQGSKLSLGAIKQRLSNTLNYNTYNREKEKQGKRLDQIEEKHDRPSYASEDFFATNQIEPSQLLNDAVSSPRILRLHKRNNRTKSTPFDKDEIIDMPKLSSHLDMSPHIDSRVEDQTPFEHSSVSEYYRGPHTIFQHKRSGIPTLNLHGSTTSFQGRDSQISSPFKIEHVPKNLYEAESELNQEIKQSKGLFHVDDDHRSHIEHVSMLEMNEDRSVMVNDSVASQARGTSKVEPVMHQKLKNMIKQDIGFRKPKQDNKSAIKLDESASRKMKSSFVSIDNDKLSVQSRRRLELNEMSQKEGIGSTRRTISRQEISDRDFLGYSSSKRNVFAKMSPLQPLKIADIRQDQMLESLKIPKGVEEENEEEQKSQAETFKSPKQIVELPRTQTLEESEKKPEHNETYRTEESSDVSMGEMIQQEMQFKMALEAQKGKKKIPALALPSFLTEKGHLYGVDAKYAGSPRDIDQHSDKEDEKPKRTIVRKTEYQQYQQTQGQSNLAAKKTKVPILKVSGLTRGEERHIPNQQEIERIQDIFMGGNMIGLEQSLSASNSKMQVAMDAKRKHHSPKGTIKSLTKEFPLTNTNMDEILTENLFYYSERKLRKIYEDDELHVLVISLMISLLLTPNRGTLDEHYTSQYPIDDGKPNILYIMHFHLNHPSNQHILPLLLQRMAEINPYPAGQRLLKLLCISFSDMSIYTDKKKIGGGAYGIVFECNTNLADPMTVAIKETKFPSSIHDRCALHDIFTEITCLEQFRLDPAVTDIYDYGVTDSSYIIVMKKYPVSLREWRNKQEGSWMDNLPTYLTIYKDVLKTVSMLHSNNITHYDLKCDNVLLDYKTNNNMQWNSESDIRVVLGDFGECKMFTSEQDELCLRNRGTEYIKSPEMLTLTINCKREADNFDRRRKVGTTRASDIWSLGCLLYEILTGDFLFYDQDWIQFYIRVTSPKEILLTEEKLNKIGNNVYIVDFLKYILVREPQHRPSINNVLKRFEHIHAILVSNLTYFDHHALNLPVHASATISTSLEGTLESYVELLFPNQAAIQEKITIPHKLKHPPTYMKIMDEISICSKTYFITNLDKLVRNGITHIVTTNDLIDEKFLTRFRYMTINVADDQRLNMLPYIFAPKLMDYLRVLFLHKGNVLFVEDDNISINSKPAKLVLRTTLLFCLTHVFKCSVYETWTLINSQVLFFSLPFSHLSMMSNLMIHHLKISQFVHPLPKIQCICGCCTLVLKRQFNLDKNINTKPCSCSRETKTIEFSDCPSDGCTEYMKYIKEKYRIPWETLKWAYFSPQDIFIGPKGTGSIQEKFQVKIILNSEGILENSIPYPKKYRKTTISYASVGSPNKDKWEIYQCKYCLMWLFAENKIDHKYAVLTNNMIKQKQGGIMMPQAQLGHKIRAPTLRNFKLSELR